MTMDLSESLLSGFQGVLWDHRSKSPFFSLSSLPFFQISEPLLLTLGLEVFLYNIFQRHFLGKPINLILNLNDLKLDILFRRLMEQRLPLIFLDYLFFLMRKIMDFS